MVNAIPETVEIESYVRGRTFEAMESANAKVNQALTGTAYSIDTNVEIIDIPGYAPLVNDLNMCNLAKDALEAVAPEEVLDVQHAVGTGSTDMGDLSSFMPVVHPYAGGAVGKSHGNDYEIADPERACVTSAKWQLAMIKLLLSDGAERAKRIIAEHNPIFPSAQAFLDYQDSINTSGDRIEYRDDGSAVIKSVSKLTTDCSENI